MTNRPWIFYVPLTVYAAWTVLLGFGDSYPTAPSHVMEHVFGRWDWLVALCAFFCGAWALRDLRRNGSSWQNGVPLACLIALVWMSAAGSAYCVARSQQYADNELRPWDFIFKDQASNLAVALWTTVAFLDVYGGLRWPQRLGSDSAAP